MVLSRMLTALCLCATAGCGEELMQPHSPESLHPQLHETSVSCSLAQVPASATVVTCFTFVLQPGVWHGFILELSTSQPSGTPDGSYNRSTLNHPYVLALPQGYRELGITELGTPFEDIFAFETEFNGVQWFDVLRLQASAANGPQSVPIVVFWASATEIGGDIKDTIAGLESSGMLNGGQANALSRKINQALKLIAEDKNAAAINVIHGFAQQISDLLADGVLTTTTAALLTSWAQYMIESI